MKKLNFFKLNMYKKLAITLIIVGFIPMLLVVSLTGSRMFDEYESSMVSQYESANKYIASDVVSVLDSYNTISKLPYYYNLSDNASTVNNVYSFDNFRKIIYGENYPAEYMNEDRNRDMNQFLRYIQTVNSNIVAAHFVGKDLNGDKIYFHNSTYSTYFTDENLFERTMDYDEWDTASKQMIIIPPHKMNYFSGIDQEVITVCRNYFDLRGQVDNQPYVGTLFIDINLKQFERLFWNLDSSDNDRYFVINQDYQCLYSTADGFNGRNIKRLLTRDDEIHIGKLEIVTEAEDYDISIVAVRDRDEAFGKVRHIQTQMYVILVVSALVIILGSFISSKKLTKPIYEMIEQMKKIEKGNFDIHIETKSEYEIDILADKFNEMSAALKQYIDQSYKAKIKQNEAELTALKSQIYPHFLYNTLEIIRMTSLEDGENKVPEMIESLSQQIHYLIGPMQDMVLLEDEIDIIKKYIYLLNCRINGKVQFTVNYSNLHDVLIPKLILQPVVENAYVHGIKPKTGSGSILVDAEDDGKNLVINVMDNGVGMDSDNLKAIYDLMESDAPGIKNENNWQSIGLKNVNDRIRYLYGENYGIEITSTVGVGTIIKITIPLMRKDFSEHEQDKNDFGR